MRQLRGWHVFIKLKFYNSIESRESRKPIMAIVFRFHPKKAVEAAAMLLTHIPLVMEG